MTLHVGLCERSGKRLYTSKTAAIRANVRNGHRLRAYVCPACHGWHVTKERRVSA